MQIVNSSGRPRLSDWIRGLTAGAALGLVVLGLGGRIAMRGIALAQGQPEAFSFEGSLTVVMLGGGAGAVVAAIFLLVRVLLPRRRILRGIIFWAIVAGFVLRGLNPVTVLNLTLFAPLFVLHGAMLTAYWCRVHLRHPRVTSPAIP